ncbi:MAG TPA: glucokinase [Candidatus Binataceae bacterium]|nr:glucokinase [Candidatus Binataceae bacterium]
MAGWILAGDVGGTKTHLGLYKAGTGPLELIRDRIYPTSQFKSLEDACTLFFEGKPEVDAACVGVPGPIIDGNAHPTNVPWTITSEGLAQSLGGVPVLLLNDLCAMAYGAIHLKPSERTTLHEATDPPEHGNIAVLAAGTGLGEASLVWEEGGYYAVASEGGHCDFAPRGEDQIELLKFLEAEFGHVSFERVLSGPGLENIYRFVRKASRLREPSWLTEKMKTEDRAAAISAAALAGTDPACAHALTMFCEIYGAEAANLALKVLAMGGVYLGGGIAPKILPMLQGGAFMKGFMAKGRLQAILSRIEVRVALEPATALFGAAHCAASLR